MMSGFSSATNRLAGTMLTMLVAGAAAATPYDGTYRPSADSDCSRVGVEGGALRIEDNLFEGFGSECRMIRPVDVVDMDATLYTMECQAGETRWTERAMLMRAAGDDGVIMLWNGYAFRYTRCTPEEIAGPPVAVDPPPVRPAYGPRVLLPKIALPEITLPMIGLPADGMATSAPAAETAQPPTAAPAGGSSAAADSDEAG